MFLHDPAVRAAHPSLHVGLLLLRRARRLDPAAAPPGHGRAHPLARLCAGLAAGGGARIAAFDLDRVAGTLRVCHATGAERFEGAGNAPSRPSPGEVIFMDAAGWVHARDWSARRSPRSALSDRTRTALVVVQALHPGAAAEVRGILDHLAGRLRAAGGDVQTLDLGFGGAGRGAIAGPGREGAA